MSWPEVERRLNQGAVAVLPVGAGAKEHGFHLPMGTDRLQAELLCAELSKRVDVLVWPVVPYGHYPAFIEFPGSLSVSARVFSDFVRELVDGLLAVARRVMILNTGISTIRPLESARASSANPVRVSLANVYRGTAYLKALEETQTQERGTHADEAETSLMLTLAPHVVDMSVATTCLTRGDLKGRFSRQPDHPNYTPSGVFGDAKRAHSESGAKLLQAMLDDLTNLIAAEA